MKKIITLIFLFVIISVFCKNVQPQNFKLNKYSAFDECGNKEITIQNISENNPDYFRKHNNKFSDTIILKTEKRLPILNGFRFVPSEIIKDPFVNTYFKVNAGSGTALDLKSYIRNFNGNIIDTMSGNMTYLVAEIEFQYALNDWLALYGNFGGRGRLGTNTYTILKSGISYATGFTIGSKFRVVNEKEFVLSLDADFNSSHVYSYSLYEYIKDIVKNIGDTTVKNNLLSEDYLTRMFLNVNAAYAPNDWFGFLGNAGFGFGKPFKEKNRDNYRIGLAASVDFINVKYIRFPIGILGSIKYNAFSEGGENADNIVTYGLRIGYTGHKDFDIGIEATYNRLKYNLTDEIINTLQYAAKVRYYF